MLKSVSREVGGEVGEVGEVGGEVGEVGESEETGRQAHVAD